MAEIYNQNTNPNNRPSEGSVGPIIGAIIVLAVIIIGGLYFWGGHANTVENGTYQASTTTDNMVTSPATTTATSTNTGAFEYQGS